MKKYSGAFFYNNEMLSQEELYYDSVERKWILHPISFHLEGIFQDSLRFIGIEDGKNCKGNFASITTNTVYSTSKNNFEDILINCPSKNGVYTGLFSFRKHKDRYSLCLADDKVHQFGIPKHTDPADGWLTALQNKGLKLV